MKQTVFQYYLGIRDIQIFS